MKRIVPVMVAVAFAAFGQSLAFAKGSGNAAAPSVSPPANSHAMANSNGPFSTDRDFGRDRAEDRMSAEGKANVKKPKKVASAKLTKPRAKPATPAIPPVENGKA